MAFEENGGGLRHEVMQAIAVHERAFSVSLDEEQRTKLADLYDVIQLHNELLHLVGPSSAEEFAVRHILESLTLLPYLEQGMRFTDVGPGGGFPSIPCLLVRSDLHATLIESKQKKAAFLADAISTLGIDGRATVVNRQFSEAAPGEGSTAVTCRALDKFVDNLPRLIKWAGDRRLLLFGGPGLEQALVGSGLPFEKKLMPMSEQRYLFIAG
jgi:16S rRNA (guanine(527)-N(7))-methyltransferase RsmG